MATVFTGSAPTSSAASHNSHLDSDHEHRIHWLVNAAFLQEIKDSNPHLWHEVHRLRTLCEVESIDFDKPQTSLRELIGCLDGLRDLLALQFALEESYGLIAADTATAQHAAAQQSIAEQNEAERERQQMVRDVTGQHRKLYLQLIDLVELSEELQYRGCETRNLRMLVDSIERFSADLTAHERLEAELIRIHDSRARTGCMND